jgi:hypothetical protein
MSQQNLASKYRPKWKCVPESAQIWMEANLLNAFSCDWLTSFDVKHKSS